MYPDLITPRSFPELLEKLDYDPFHLMPKGFPTRPYIFTTPAKLAVTRRLVKGKGWPAKALDLLLKKAAEPCPFPEVPPPENHPQTSAGVMHALRNAYAALLLGDPACRERGLDSLRRVARAYPAWPVRKNHGRLKGGDIGEASVIHMAASAYDCLAALGLEPEDDRLFRSFLESTRASSDTAGHPTCGNHGTAVMRGRMAASAALGDLQGIHDTLYGCNKEDRWRYGLIHQLRHDFLSDGLHWERSPGYHFLTTHLVSEMCDMMEHLGVDLWNKPLPPLHQDDGRDLHRAYGPDQGLKTFKAAFDAPFYFAFNGGDMSLLGDSGLSNMRGYYIWGTLYNLAYEAYKDPKYAWLLNKAERDYPREKRVHPDLPMPFQDTWIGDLALARYQRASYPDKPFDLMDDTPISLQGRHEKGCSLFPAYGAAVLRGNAKKADGPEAFLFWGPHTAGHQAPASLHLDLHGNGFRATDAPRMDKRGYGDPNFLTWPRTTIAHNTVTVDGKPMFPYDFPTESIWECDRWRDTVSDSEFLLFQPDGKGFKAMRARNQNVYKDTLLDRTVVVTGDFVLDVYRVVADRVRQFDWSMHVVGTPGLPAGAKPADLGKERGYCHFIDARRLPKPAGNLSLSWDQPQGKTTVSAVLPARCEIYTARDLLPAEEEIRTFGDIAPVPPRHTLILRTRGKSALFVSAWSFDGKPVPVALVKGAADADVTVKAGNRTWRLPLANQPLR